ncbi:hypothetical protein [Streptomyces yaizuensis]|uniref:Uncharacterized protein n=1 Tax=Streptomyces yaizuensis TaxID=2989713 RepID=A0AA86IVL0_9ACTN|nr:hypothetical protein [Streptomyces sp. YSPA8]BDT39510.1 hypothetical protein SYYSPA8_36960 [Streptomyces sp. YSPA8]
MEFIRAAASLDERADWELQKTGITGCLQFAVDNLDGRRKEIWAGAQGSIEGLTSELDRWHCLSDLATEEEEGLKGLEGQEKKDRNSLVYGLRSLLADLEPKGIVSQFMREDRESFISRFHREFFGRAFDGNCSSLGYCPCRK